MEARASSACDGPQDPLWAETLGGGLLEGGLSLPTCTRKSSSGVSPPPTPGCPLPSLGLTCLGQKAGRGGPGGRWLCPSPPKAPWDLPSSPCHSRRSAKHQAALAAVSSSHPTPQPLHRPSTGPAGPGIRQGPRDRPGLRGPWGCWKGEESQTHTSGWPCGGGGLGGPLQPPGYMTLWCRAPSVQPAPEPQPVLVLGLQPHPLDPVVTGLGLCLPETPGPLSGFLERDVRPVSPPPTEPVLDPKPGPQHPEQSTSPVCRRCVPGWTLTPSWPGIHPDRPQAPCGQSYHWSAAAGSPKLTGTAAWHWL